VALRLASILSPSLLATSISRCRANVLSSMSPRTPFSPNSSPSISDSLATAAFRSSPRDAILAEAASFFCSASAFWASSDCLLSPISPIFSERPSSRILSLRISESMAEILSVSRLISAPAASARRFSSTISEPFSSASSLSIISCAAARAVSAPSISFSRQPSRSFKPEDSSSIAASRSLLSAMDLSRRGREDPISSSWNVFLEMLLFSSSSCRSILDICPSIPSSPSSRSLLTPSAEAILSDRSRSLFFSSAANLILER